jgi:molybdopterin synthase catalytic subunit/molybdopterin synthase sulfur carrier subunit
MKLRVQYTAQMRTVAGRNEDEVELPEGSSLATLLDHLADRLGRDAAAHLVTAAGEAQCSLLIVLNDSAVASHQASTTFLGADDVITLLPPIAGG